MRPPLGATLAFQAAKSSASWRWEIAFLSLIVGAVAHVRQHNLQRQLANVTLARRDEKVAARQAADMHVALVQRGKGEVFKLRNDGPADAHEVDIHLPEEAKAAVTILDPLPLETLAAGDSHDVLASLGGFGERPNLTAELRWIDGSGEQRKPFPVSLSAE